MKKCLSLTASNVNALYYIASSYQSLADLTNAEVIIIKLLQIFLTVNWPENPRRPLIKYTARLDKIHPETVLRPGMMLRPEMRVIPEPMFLLKIKNLRIGYQINKRVVYKTCERYLHKRCMNT